MHNKSHEFSNGVTLNIYYSPPKRSWLAYFRHSIKFKDYNLCQDHHWRYFDSQGKSQCFLSLDTLVKALIQANKIKKFGGVVNQFYPGACNQSQIDEMNNVDFYKIFDIPRGSFVLAQWNRIYQEIL